VLRVGRVSVAIRRLVHSCNSAGEEPAGKAQLDRDQLYFVRQAVDQKDFLMSISICSSLR
jgi:hypothetical protein